MKKDVKVQNSRQRRMLQCPRRKGLRDTPFPSTDLQNTELRKEKLGTLLPYMMREDGHYAHVGAVHLDRIKEVRLVAVQLGSC